MYSEVCEVVLEGSGFGLSNIGVAKGLYNFESPCIGTGSETQARKQIVDEFITTAWNLVILGTCNVSSLH